MTAKLSADEFSNFFRAVQLKRYRRRQDPFRWQQRLAAQVLSGDDPANAGWPDVLDVPTGAGKTAAIDIAVFHLALQAEKRDRIAPVRILFVVDRRLVVDDAYTRARDLAQVLAAAVRPNPVEDEHTDVLRRVGQRLGELAESPGRPLLVARLRGGLPREPDWVRTPSQPTVVVSTVDQVGSRLLFRGYGVTDSMKPVHAGLLGTDSLILLDEAHLSQPFAQTLKAVRASQAPWERPTGPEKGRVGVPLSVVTLSATHAAEQGVKTFRLDPGEADAEGPVLSARLQASKAAELDEVQAAPDGDVFAGEFVEHAVRLSVLGGGVRGSSRSWSTG